MNSAVFLIQCRDRKGLLGKISSFFAENDFNILHCSQYTDVLENKYFMRLAVDLSSAQVSRRDLEDRFHRFAAPLELNFSVHYSNERQRVAVMVSRASHCLYDLLMQADEGTLDCEIPLVVGNHPQLEQVADRFRVPFFCFPVGDDKIAQEQKIIELFQREHIDLVVLARYMQILSDHFIETFHGRIINIHHAFLPAFQGGNPYERAWERGVKMIGATAHYATADLDEGPIIEQDVERISHENTPADLKDIGRDIERRVLTRAVRAHLEHRVIVSGRRTIVL